MSDPAGPGPGTALVDDLAAKIQAAIVTGDHPIGSRLRQSALADRYGVSRTPIREALRKLQAAGVVEVRPNAGALVRGPSPRDVRESYAVRAELEGLAAELAASWITRSQLDRLEEAERLFAEATAALRAEGSDAAAAQASWASANDIFHEAIHTAAGNAFLQTTIEGLHRSFPRQLTWAPLMEDPQLLEENAREHRAIREALDRRSREDARRLMTAHVQRSGELVARWFERQAQAG